jgi:glutamate--cysteine ligase
MTTAMTEDEAAAFIGRACFRTGPARRIGVELEWLVDPVGDQSVLSGLPHGGLVTREPGGQVELSSLPADDIATCIAAVETDMDALRAALALRGQTVLGGAFDDVREPVRFHPHPRYQAMEDYFDRDGPWGLRMMCCTASIQVNVDAGDEGEGVTGLLGRWNLAHRIGPVLVAAFANSPLIDGRPSGWKSTRQALLYRIDPSRVRPMHDTDDLRRDFAQYALDARVLCLRFDPPARWTAPRDLTLRSWIRDGHNGTRPTAGDIRYHLTTLFPPVRPRGWLELRMIDQQHGDGWIVPALVAATLMDDPACAAAAYEATAAICDGGSQPPWPVWLDAAHVGLGDPTLRAVADECFGAVEKALRRGGTPPRLRERFTEFRRRYLDVGRCPGDDLIDRAFPGARGADALTLNPLAAALEAPL